MHSLISLVAFALASSDPWERIIASVHLDRAAILTPNDTRGYSPEQLQARLQNGAVAILEGDSEHARALGIRKGERAIAVRSLIDIHNPRLPIVWEKPLMVTEPVLPADARVFAREKWSDAPLLAGIRSGSGAVLWAATAPGDRGYERFPYVLQALMELGLQPLAEARDLWAFFDSSYRARADLDYLAAGWRRGGIAALHVAAWHYNEADPVRDEYLHRLIAACHRAGIAVYAWLELPHVSEKFWNDHPQWREKTAIGQDAHLDWRRLMNLQNRECAAAIAAATQALLLRFDWDGVNLAELYFESLEGAANPARFTPFNQDVRAAFEKMHGTDPAAILSRPDDPLLAKFLEYRAELARDMQQHWIAELMKLRSRKPHLDIVLTHVDDRFDSRMREMIGADAARLMPLVERHDLTFLIEDPATVWHLGPERYTEIAEKYRAISASPERLAIDINIVERYQDVYPTKQQTGSELMQLVHLASRAFGRVALYFENSIFKPDWPLLPAAAATVKTFERDASGITVDSGRPIYLKWQGPAKVNGRVWGIRDGRTLHLPAGKHRIEVADSEPALTVTDLNAQLLSAATDGSTLQFTYASQSRAAATFSSPPASIRIDGTPLAFQGQSALLPRGKHTVIVSR